jgi:hypothetical protein
VTGIAPGVFSSEMMDGMLARVDDFRKAFPRQRLGEAPQLDITLLHLVSTASECVTGTIIKVDDGQDPKQETKMLSLTCEQDCGDAGKKNGGLGRARDRVDRQESHCGVDRVERLRSCKVVDSAHNS